MICIHNLSYRYGSFLLPPITAFFLTLLQTIFIQCPGTIESLSVSDKTFGRISMVVLLVFSYGQSIGLSILTGSHSRIYLALIGSEVNSRSTVFTLFSQLYWAFWGVLTLAIRYWKNSRRSTHLETNHLFLNFSTLLTVAAGCVMVVLRVLTYERMSMVYYAQGACHIHLLFICLVICNHVECRQFAVRKVLSWPGISQVKATYEVLITLYVVMRAGNSVRPIEVMMV